MLGQGKNVQMTEPSLWSFARSSIKAGWRLIETTFPNLEQGYGPEARIYSMKARDETAYFYDTTWKVYWAQPRPDVPGACPVAILVLPEDDVPMSRPIDPLSPKSVRDFEKSRRAVAEMYKHLLYTPLKERGTIIIADDLAVQTLQETRRRWRIVLDKLRHFVDVLTDLLYVVASTTGDPSRVGKNTGGPKLDYNRAASQVFQILIKLNRYESMFIVTMSFLSQLADEEIFLSSAVADHLLDDEHFHHTQHHHEQHTRARSTSNATIEGPMTISHHSTGQHLNHPSTSQYMPRRVSWRQVKKGQQDLMDTLKATKRQAESLKSIIDHQNSMRESRLANQHARIANRHAAEASRQADEAAKQTLSMRRMTILTFIFLPITFVAALFGVNVQEFGQGSLPIWLFFAVALPFAGVVFSVWSYLEYWGQSTSSDGEGGELGKGMKAREEEMEAAMLKLDEEENGELEDEKLADGGFAGWETGDRMV
ncbi:hypothetical protein DFH27DRAFT_274768 [Peziza echinospora]|nr:hypothetical protein DFH27DRAFT_274768 [Peziza echinospora]